MGCCGSGSKNKTKNQAFARSLTASVEIAAEGFAEVEYIGGRSSGERFSVYGYKTGTMYRVTPGKTFSVDSQDLLGGSSKNPGILEMMEVNKLMFKIVKEGKTATKLARLGEEKTLPQPDSKPYKDGVDDNTVDTRVRESFAKNYFGEEEPDPDDVVDLFTPLDGNLSELDYALQNGSHNLRALEEMWAYELANQNRKGAFTRIEEAIEKVKAEGEDV